MKVTELKNDPLIIEWFKFRRAKSNTQEGYLFSMQEYTEFTGMSPAELIEEAEVEVDARTKPRKQKIRGYIISFREHLIGKGNAPLTVEQRVTGVRSFYKAFDIIIPEVERRDTTAKSLETNKGLPEKEDIRKVLGIADPFEKAFILVGLSSGLSVNEITNMKVKDFTNGYNPEDEITTLKLRREKTNYDFVTFLTPEATRAVKNYIDHRNRTPKEGNKTRRLDQLRKQKVTNENGYLFVSRHIEDEFLETGNEEIRKIGEAGIQDAYRKLSEDAGLSGKKGIWNKIRSHKMRTWFTNKLREAHCDPDLREFMAGHKIQGSKANYFVDNEKELKEAYENCIPYLTIEKAMDVSESDEFKRIKVQNELLIVEAENNRLEKEDYLAVKKELDQLKALIEGKTHVINEFEQLYDNPKDRILAIEKFVRPLDPVEDKQLIEELKTDE